MDIDDFESIRQSANGMLPAATYQRIHNCAKDSQGNIVEVGTAHGAATICMAAALQPGVGKVYTFEKVLGGSRERFGTLNDNVRIIQSNYRRFNVDDRIQQFIGDVVVEAKGVDHVSAFSMLMLDADGRLDRDFVLFYDRLKPGSHIVIDDCDDRVKLKLKSGALLVHQKKKLTHLFIKRLEELGYLERIELVGNTYFGRKPEAGVRSVQELTVLDISAVYANLVFCRINYVDLMLKKLISLPYRLKRKLSKLSKRS